MQHSKRPYIEYEPRSKPKFIAKIAFVLIAILIVVAIVALEKDKRKNAANEKIITTDKGPLEVNRGQSMHTRFFDVIVDSASFADKKVRINQLINLPKDDSNRYFIIEIVLKNTDTESKLMPDGELMIENENGNEKIKFDNSITLIQEGWGQLMDNIGAGVTKKTKLVYKIPAGASGNAYYYPDILYSNDRIFLMKL